MRAETKTGPDASPGAPPIPVIKDINQSVYAAANQPGALNMAVCHTCETTHSLAGWVVVLAGDAGTKLERHYGAELAARLIYRESKSPINPARLYDGDDDAIADMKARAGVQ